MKTVSSIEIKLPPFFGVRKTAVITCRESPQLFINMAVHMEELLTGLEKALREKRDSYTQLIDNAFKGDVELVSLDASHVIEQPKSEYPVSAFIRDKFFLGPYEIGRFKDEENRLVVSFNVITLETSVMDLYEHVIRSAIAHAYVLGRGVD